MTALLPAFAGTPRTENDALINRIHHVELMELCQAVGENSVDLILCDLPYG